jgi:hypothetical protein
MTVSESQASDILGSRPLTIEAINHYVTQVCRGNGQLLFATKRKSLRDRHNNDIKQSTSYEHVYFVFLMTEETTCFSNTTRCTYLKIQTRGFCNWGVDHGIIAITVPMLDLPNIYQYSPVPH